MIFIQPYKATFCFFCSPNIITYILDTASAIKKMTEIRDFIFKNYYRQVKFLKKTVIIEWNIGRKDLQLSATKLTEKIPDPSNVKE